MHDRAYALATGLFVVLALATLVVVGYWMSGAAPERRPYLIVSGHPVSGLAEGSQVMYRGVPAGRVESIRISPANPEEVLVRIMVGPDIPIHQSTYARLRQRGFTGVAQVELDDTGAHPHPLLTVPETPGRIPMRASLVDEITDAGTETLATLNTLLESLNAMLDDEMQARVRSVLANVDQTLATTERLARALEQDLPRTLDSANRSLDSVADLADRATQSMDQVDALVNELRETAEVARRLGDQFSDRAMPGVDRAIDAVDRAAREMARLAQSLAQQPEALLRGRQRPAPGPGESQ
jgi:phospholipid/cholesterol/gamma-HCH transport system substrate-binding protein